MERRRDEEDPHRKEMPDAGVIDSDEMQALGNHIISQLRRAVGFGKGIDFLILRELVSGIYLQHDEHNSFAMLDRVLRDTVAAEPVWKRLRNELPEAKSLLPADVLARAIAAGKVSDDEVVLLQRQEYGRQKIIAVDDFDPADLPRAQFQRREKSAQALQEKVA